VVLDPYPVGARVIVASFVRRYRGRSGKVEQVNSSASEIGVTIAGRTTWFAPDELRAA